MATEARASFTEQLRKRLAAEVTVEQMKRILGAVTEVMMSFDITEIPEGDLSQDDLLKQYAAALAVQSRSQKTIDRYVYEIERMIKAVGVPCGRVTVHHLRAYLAKEKERGIGDSTLEGNRQIFSAFFNWLQRESLIEKNPTANLGPIKCAKKKKQIYSEVDIEKLNQHCSGIRDRAIIAFLGSTGCRISEMIELNRDAVNLEKLECVVHGKGDKERTVYMSEVAGMMVKEYLRSRKDENEALFIGRQGGRLQPGGVRCMLNKVAAAAGVEHVHPHKFRRTLATRLTRHGMPIQDVAAILGHDKLDTTMKYVVMNDEDVKIAYRRYT